MNNRAAPPEAKTRSRTARVAGYLFVPVVVVLTFTVGTRLYHHWFRLDDSWASYNAQVLGTRVVPMGPMENSYGGYVFYRVEIHASWTVNGAKREAWVSTTKTGGDQAWLTLWASQQGKRCIVRQSPRNPSGRLAFFQ